MTLLRLLTLCLIFISTYAVNATALDSLKLEEREDGRYVIHRVASGETLFSLSKRYNADLSRIAEVNKLDGYAINIGQILEIPISNETKTKPSKSEQPPDDVTYHEVKSGETLYAISHIYGSNIYDLKVWNNLTDNSISVGQKLIVAKTGTKPTKQAPETKKKKKEVKVSDSEFHVVQAGETLFSLSKKYEMSVDEIKELNDLTDNSLSVGQSLRIKSPENPDEPVVAEVKTEKEKPVDKPVNDKPTTDEKEEKEKPEPKKYGNTDTPKPTGQFQKVYEEGMAMLIENAPETKKYLCLHRTLESGSIIQVRNRMNNQSIFVRVVGTLPDTGNNENVLIRLSEIAYKRLGAIDAKFPVEISYIPE